MLAVEAFRKDAVRSVILIDEHFAKLSDYGEASVLEKYPESHKCQELYRFFDSEHLTCDVMNKVPEIVRNGQIPEKINNSDLVILDLHLEGGQDISASTDVLKCLADSDHFNMVVVYTNDGDLIKVWRQIGGSLKGTAGGPATVTDGEPDWELAMSELLKGVNQHGELLDSLMDDFIRQKRLAGQMAIVFQELWTAAIQGSPGLARHRSKAPTIVARRALEQLGAKIDSRKSREVIGKHDGASNPWLKSGNVFIAIAQKRYGTNGGTAPHELTTVLDDAIKDWNPGLVRAVLAQIQNMVSRRGFAFESQLAHDELTQVGWLWHAINEHQQCSSGVCPGSEQSSHQIILDRTIEAMRARLLNNRKLSDFASRCLNEATNQTVSDDILSRARKASGVVFEKEPSDRDVLHSINRYLSSISFDGSFVTTGTILHFSGRWCVCVEPACDTVPSQAGDDAVKFLPIKVIELYRTEADVLHEATHSHYVFVQHNGNPIFLDSRNNATNSPTPSVIYVPRHNQIENDASPPKRYVTVRRFNPKSDGEGIEKERWEVVAQLRYSYACRLLHMAGYHLSRIGVDFVNLPVPRSEPVTQLEPFQFGCL